MRKLILWLVAMVSLSGCALHLFEIKYSPTPSPTPPPSSSDSGSASSLVDRSRAEAKAKTKTFISNIGIDSTFASSVGLSSSNCIQVVELKAKDVVVDFGIDACPASGGFLAAEKIAFTLHYEEI